MTNPGRPSPAIRTALLPLALLSLVVVTAVAPRPALARQDTSLRFEQEAEVVQADLEHVISAHDRVRGAWMSLDRTATALKNGLGSPDTPVATLRQLDEQAMAALEAFYRAMHDGSGERTRLYDSMDRLAQIGHDMGQQAQVAEGDVNGRWQVEVDHTGVSGLLVLHSDGIHVQGDYQLSNGASGSLEGTIGASDAELAKGSLQTKGERTLELVRYDRVRGRDARATAKIAPGETTMTGTLEPYDLGINAPSVLTWTARRLGPDEPAP